LLKSPQDSNYVLRQLVAPPILPTFNVSAAFPKCVELAQDHLMLV